MIGGPPDFGLGIRGSPNKAPSRSVPERVKISPRDLGALRALGYTDERISTMDLDEVDLIIFSRLKASDCGVGHG